MYYFFSTAWKKLDNGKTITYKLEFIDSFKFMRQPDYQNLLIICLKLIATNVDIKTVNLSMSLKGLKITNLRVIAKSVKKTIKTNKWIN